MKKSNSHKGMLLVHMQKGEAQGLDFGQGGASFDELTGLREYKKWKDLIHRPEMQDVFQSVVADQKDNGKIDNPEIQSVYQQGEDQMPPWEDAPGDSDPFLAQLAAKGRNGDDIVVWLPVDFIKVIGKLEHKLSENPKTGLLEFGRLGNVFKSVIRVGGTVGGFMLGGPAGAGIGRTIAGVATGQKPGHAAMAGLRDFGLSTLGNSFIPGMAGYSGAGIGGMGAMGNLGGIGTLGSMFGGAAPSSAATTAGSAAQVAGSAAPTAAAAAAAPAAQQGVMGSLFSNPQMNQLMGIGALGLMKHVHNRDEASRQKRAFEEGRRLWDQDLRKYGLVPTKDVEPGRQRYINPRYGSATGQYEPLELSSGGRAKNAHTSVQHQPMMHEPLVQGPGRGQDDRVYTDVPQNTYIVPADAVSMAGDGSTRAGAKAWSEWEQKVMAKSPGGKWRGIAIEGHGGGHNPVPVALSDGEMKLHPDIVTTLGNGNAVQGSKIVKEMIENLRKSKGRARGGLSPKAGPLERYMPRRA